MRTSATACPCLDTLVKIMTQPGWWRGETGKKGPRGANTETYFRLRLSWTMHSTLSQRQLLHGTPSTTSQRTLRARHDAQALAALLLVTLPSGPTELRFLGGDVVDVGAVPVVADVDAVAAVDAEAVAVTVVAAAGAAVAEFCSGAEGT